MKGVRDSLLWYEDQMYRTVDHTQTLFIFTGRLGKCESKPPTNHHANRFVTIVSEFSEQPDGEAVFGQC